VYVVALTPYERIRLLDFIRWHPHLPRKVIRARILLGADDGKTDGELAEELDTSISTVHRTRQRYVEEGLDRALNDQPRPGGKKKLSEKGESVLAALARSEPPPGQRQWTLQSLADYLIELNVVDSISYETVRQELRKSGISLQPSLDLLLCRRLPRPYSPFHSEPRRKS